MVLSNIPPSNWASAPQGQPRTGRGHFGSCTRTLGKNYAWRRGWRRQVSVRLAQLASCVCGLPARST